MTKSFRLTAVVCVRVCVCVCVFVCVFVCVCVQEDEELKALTEKMAAKAGGKGGQISKVATQKYTGSQGGIVKRLQKELIRIQGTGSFEVELVNDSIFEVCWRHLLSPSLSLSLSLTLSLLLSFYLSICFIC